MSDDRDEAWPDKGWEATDLTGVAEQIERLTTEVRAHARSHDDPRVQLEIVLKLGQAEQLATALRMIDLPPQVVDQDGAASMPPVFARWRCGAQAFATDDAPFGMMVLPGPKQNTYVLSAAGTPEQVWGMYKCIAAYVQGTGIMAAARAGEFGDTLPRAKLLNEREYDA